MDKEFYIMFETWYKCEKHGVTYPKGAKCPACEKEKLNERD